MKKPRKAKPGKVRMAAMAPSVPPRKGGTVRGASGDEGAGGLRKFGGGKVSDRGVKR